MAFLKFLMYKILGEVISGALCCLFSCSDLSLIAMERRCSVRLLS
jgi:hypothetical protein